MAEQTPPGGEDIEVDAPDGTRLSFPSSMSMDAIKDVMRRKYGPKKQDTTFQTAQPSSTTPSGAVAGLSGAATSGVESPAISEPQPAPSAPGSFTPQAAAANIDAQLGSSVRPKGLLNDDLRIFYTKQRDDLQKKLDDSKFMGFTKKGADPSIARSLASVDRVLQEDATLDPQGHQNTVGTYKAQQEEKKHMSNPWLMYGTPEGQGRLKEIANAADAAEQDTMWKDTAGDPLADVTQGIPDPDVFNRYKNVKYTADMAATDPRMDKMYSDYENIAPRIGDNKTQMTLQERKDRIEEGALSRRDDLQYQTDVLQFQGRRLSGRALRLQEALKNGTPPEQLQQEAADIGAGLTYVQEKMKEVATKDPRSFADKIREIEQTISNTTPQHTAANDATGAFLYSFQNTLKSSLAGAARLIDTSDGYSNAVKLSDWAAEATKDTDALIADKNKGTILNGLANGAGTMAAMFSTGLGGALGKAPIVAASLTMEYESYVRQAIDGGLSQDDAESAGLIYAPIAAAIELVNPQAYLASGELKAFRSQFIKLIREGTDPKSAMRIVLESAPAGLKESIEELSQTLTERGTNHGVNVMTGSDLNDSLPTMKEAGETVLISTLLGSFAEGSSRMAGNTKSARTRAQAEAMRWAAANPNEAQKIAATLPPAEQDAFKERLDALSKAYNGNDLMKKDPVKAAEIVDAIEAKNAVEEEISAAPMDPVLEAANGDPRKRRVAEMTKELLALNGDKNAKAAIVANGIEDAPEGTKVVTNADGSVTLEKKPSTEDKQKKNAEAATAEVFTESTTVRRTIEDLGTRDLRKVANALYVGPKKNESWPKASYLEVLSKEDPEDVAQAIGELSGDGAYKVFIRPEGEHNFDVDPELYGEYDTIEEAEAAVDDLDGGGNVHERRPDDDAMAYIESIDENEDWVDHNYTGSMTAHATKVRDVLEETQSRFGGKYSSKTVRSENSEGRPVDVSVKLRIADHTGNPRNDDGGPVLSVIIAKNDPTGRGQKPGHANSIYIDDDLDPNEVEEMINEALDEIAGRWADRQGEEVEENQTSDGQTDNTEEGATPTATTTGTGSTEVPTSVQPEVAPDAGVAPERIEPVLTQDVPDDRVSLAAAYEQARMDHGDEGDVDAVLAAITAGNVSTKSYERFGDKNNVAQGMAKQYLRAKGRGIDEIAQEASGITGTEVSPDDVVAFMERYPGGRPKTNDRMRELDQRHGALYGTKLNKLAAKSILAKHKGKVPKFTPQEQAIADEAEQQGVDLSELNDQDQEDFLNATEEDQDIMFGGGSTIAKFDQNAKKGTQPGTPKDAGEVRREEGTGAPKGEQRQASVKPAPAKPESGPADAAPAKRPSGSGGRPPLRVVDEGRIPQPRDVVSAGQYELSPDQVLGVNLALTTFEDGKPGFLLADGTGVGKTRQLLVIAHEHQKRTGKPAVIITQNKQIISGSFADDGKALGIGDVKLYTYDDIRNGKVPNTEYGLILFDEAHNLKNEDSSKSIAAHNMKADGRVFATATPMDRPISAAYFLSEITGRTEESIANELGYDVRTEYDDRAKRFVRMVSPKKDTTWATVLQNMLRLRGEAIANGQMIRREFPFYGEIKLKDAPLSEEFTEDQAEIDGYWQDRIADAKGPMAKKNLAGHRIGELSRLSEAYKADQIFDAAMADLKAGKHVVIIAEGVNPSSLKGLGGKTVPGLLNTLKTRFQDAGIPVASVFGDGNKGAEVKAFQGKKVKVLLATPQSGGTGINLDDTVGDAPRVLHLATINYSGDLIDQMLGRVSRRNTASPSEISMWFGAQSLSDVRRREIAKKKMTTVRRMQSGEDPDVAGFKEDAGTPAPPKPSNDITKDRNARLGPMEQRPSLRADQEPVGNDTDLVARERFDIPSLTKIGSGSDRDVYDLGDGNVLKVDKTARGLDQNTYEGDWNLHRQGLTPKPIESGVNYVVVEKVEPASGRDLIEYEGYDGGATGVTTIGEMLRQLSQFGQTHFDNKDGRLQDVLNKYGLNEVMNYDLIWNDFTAKRNWGVKGRAAVHLDGGTFGGVDLLDRHRGKKNMSDADFREAHRRSRAAKKAFGDMDKATMYQKPSSKPVKTGKLRTDRVIAALQSVAPGLTVHAPKTKAEYQKILAAQGNEGLASSWGMYNPLTNEIFVNPDGPDLKQTLFHEAAHPVLLALAKNNPEMFAQFHEELMEHPDAQKYRDHAANYKDKSDVVQAAEAMAEFMGDVGAGRVKVDSKPGSLWQRFKEWLKDILAKLGWDMRSIDLSEPKNVRDFAAQFAKAVNKGIKIDGLGKKPNATEVALQDDATRLVDGWYSRLDQTVAAKGNTQSGSDWMRWSEARAKEGALSMEEVKWTGLADFLQGKAKVTPKEVREFLKENRVKVEVKVLGAENDVASSAARDEAYNSINEAASRADYYEGSNERKRLDGVLDAWYNNPTESNKERLDEVVEDLNLRFVWDIQSGDPTKFSQYQLPGGTNYREVLVTLPKRGGSQSELEAQAQEQYGKPYAELNDAQQSNTLSYVREARKDPEFKSSHFDEPNILVHLRLNDRVVPDPATAQIQAERAKLEKERNALGPKIDELNRQMKKESVPRDERIRVEVMTELKAGKISNVTEARKEIEERQFAADSVPTPKWEERRALEEQWSDYNRRISALPKPRDQKVLFIEELQSDWGQAGKKKGFADTEAFVAEEAALKKEMLEIPSRFGGTMNMIKAAEQGDKSAIDARKRRAEIGIRLRQIEEARGRVPEHGALGGPAPPLAPFVEASDAWVELGIKQAIRMAVDGGYDRIAWTTGEQQYNRWGSQVFSWTKRGDNWYVLGQEQAGGDAFAGMEEQLSEQAFSEGRQIESRDDLRELVLATMGREKKDWSPENWKKHIDKITDGIWQQMKDGKDGSTMPRREGMKGFYDKILPTTAKKVSKKLGGDGMVGDVVMSGAAIWKVKNTATGATIKAFTFDPRGKHDIKEYENGIADGRFALVQEPRSPRTDEVGTQQSITITPAMRERVGLGVPMMQRPKSTPPVMSADERVTDIAARFVEHGTSKKEARAYMEQKGVPEEKIKGVIAAMTQARAKAKEGKETTKAIEEGTVKREPRPTITLTERQFYTQKIRDIASGFKYGFDRAAFSEKAKGRKEGMAEQKIADARTEKERIAAKKEEHRSFVNRINEVLKPLDKKLLPSQVKAIVNRAAKVNSPTQARSFADFVEKVFADAKYAADLETAQDFRKKAKKMSRRDSVPLNHKEVLASMARMDVDALTDPAAFNAVSEQYMQQFAPMTSGYVPQSSAEALDALAKMHEEAAAERFNERVEGADDALAGALAAESADAFAQDLKQDAREKLRAAMEEIANDAKFAITEQFEEEGLSVKEKSILKKLRDADIEAMSLDQMREYIKTVDNIGINISFDGAAKVAAMIEGVASVSKAREAVASTPLRRAWTGTVGSFFQEQFSSTSGLFRFLFGMGEGMAKFHNAIGATDLELSKKGYDDDVRSIKQKMAEFYTAHRKKHKNADSQESIAEEAVIAFAVQPVRGYDEQQSFDIQKGIIEENIKRLRSKEKTAKEADVWQGAYDALLKDAKTRQELLAQAKRTSLAAYESVMFLANKVLEPHSDMLRAHKEQFWGEGFGENDMYLPITYRYFGKKEDLEPSKTGARTMDGVDKPKEASNLIGRKGVISLPRGMVISPNLRRNVLTSSSRNLYDAHTSEVWQRINQFFKTPGAESVVGGVENLEYLNFGLKSLQSAQRREGGGTQDKMDRAVGALIQRARKYASHLALGGVRQFLQQPADQLTNAMVNVGPPLVGRSITQVNKALPLLSLSSIGDRGELMGGTNWDNTLEAEMASLARSLQGGLADRFDAATEKIQRAVMFALTKSDVVSARAAWLAYYTKYIEENGGQLMGWQQEADAIKDGDEFRREALAYATVNTDVTQGSSDPTKLARITQHGGNSWQSLAKGVFNPFSSFTIGMRERITNDIADITYGGEMYDADGEATPHGERAQRAARSLTATIAGNLAFTALKVYVVKAAITAGAEGLRALMQSAFDDDDDEKDDAENRLALLALILNMAHTMKVMDADIYRVVSEALKQEKRENSGFADNQAKDESIKRAKLAYTSFLQSMMVSGYTPFIEAGSVDAINRMGYYIQLLGSDPAMTNGGTPMKYEYWVKQPENPPLFRSGQGYDSGDYGVMSVISDKFGSYGAQAQELMDTANDTPDIKEKRKAKEEKAARMTSMDEIAAEVASGNMTWGEAMKAGRAQLTKDGIKEENTYDPQAPYINHLKNRIRYDRAPNWVKAVIDEDALIDRVKLARKTLNSLSGEERVKEKAALKAAGVWTDGFNAEWARTK